jgi:hypothetical protein
VHVHVCVCVCAHIFISTRVCGKRGDCLKFVPFICHASEIRRTMVEDSNASKLSTVVKKL